MPKQKTAHTSTRFLMLCSEAITGRFTASELTVKSNGNWSACNHRNDLSLLKIDDVDGFERSITRQSLSVCSSVRCIAVHPRYLPWRNCYAWRIAPDIPRPDTSCLPDYRLNSTKTRSTGNVFSFLRQTFRDTDTFRVSEQNCETLLQNCKDFRYEAQIKVV